MQRVRELKVITRSAEARQSVTIIMFQVKSVCQAAVCKLRLFAFTCGLILEPEGRVTELEARTPHVATTGLFYPHTFQNRRVGLHLAAIPLRLDKHINKSPCCKAAWVKRQEKYRTGTRQTQPDDYEAKIPNSKCVCET